MTTPLTSTEARLAADFAYSAYLDCYACDTRYAEEWMMRPTTSMATLQAKFVADSLELLYKRLLEEETGRQAKKQRIAVRRVRRRLYPTIGRAI